MSLSLLGNIHRERGSYAHALDLFHRSLKLSQEVGHKWGCSRAWNNIGLVYFAAGRLPPGHRRLQARAAPEQGDGRNDERGRWAHEHRRGGVAPRASAAGGGQLPREPPGQRARGEQGNGRRQPARPGANGARGRTACGGRPPPGTGPGIARGPEGPGRHGGGLERPRLAAAGRRPTRRGPRPGARGRRRSRARSSSPSCAGKPRPSSGVAYRRLGQADAAPVLPPGGRGDRGAPPPGRRARRGPRAVLREQALAVPRADRAGHGRGSAAEALEMAERSKARALADLVQSGRVDISGAMSDGGPARGRPAPGRAGLAATRRSRRRRLTEAPDAGRARVARSRAAGEAIRLRDLPDRGLRADTPTCRSSVAGRLRSRSRRRHALVPDASVAVLEYAVTEEATYLFVLTRDQGPPKLHSYTLATGRRSLAAPGPPASRAAGRPGPRLRGRRAPALRPAARPGAPALQGKTHLVVVPDGPLWEVPFQALQDAAGRYVIESAAVSYAPSLTVLRETLRTSGERRPAARCSRWARRTSARRARARPSPDVRPGAAARRGAAGPARSAASTDRSAARPTSARKPARTASRRRRRATPSCTSPRTACSTRPARSTRTSCSRRGRADRPRTGCSRPGR